MAHKHQHNHHHHQLSGKNIGIAVFLNVIITVSQLVGGLISGSMALLTDALHNFSDVISLLISYLTNRLAKRKSTVKQTFGFKRAEILSAFINSTTLIAIAIFLIIEAIKRFLNPEPILPDIVIYFALASIVINFISVLLLQKDAQNSMNIKSAYLHLLTDVMTSIAVMLGGIAMKYFSIYWIDSLLSIAIAIYLVFSSYGLLLASIKILMQFTPQDTDIETIREEITSIEKVKNLHHVHFWQLTEKNLFFEAHIDIEEDISISKFQQILLKIETILKNKHITHFNIQPEYKRNDCKKLIVQDY